MLFANKFIPLSWVTFCLPLALISSDVMSASADPTAAQTQATSTSPSPPAPPAASGESSNTVFAPVATPVATTTTEVFNVSQVMAIAVLAVQPYPQALWQGGSPVASPQTIVYSNGVVLYDWGSPARSMHDNYDVMKTYLDAGAGETKTEWHRIWKVIQLTPDQLNAFVKSLHEDDLDKLGQTTYNYSKLPHYILSYAPASGDSSNAAKLRTVTIGGPLNSYDDDDSFYKTADLTSLTAASDLDIGEARSHTPKALLSAIDFMQYYNPKQAAFPDPNEFFIHLSPASDSKAQPWPDTLPQIDDSNFKADDSNSSDLTGDLQQSDYAAISAMLAKTPRNNVYMVNGKPWHVIAQSDYMLPSLPQVYSTLMDRQGNAAE